MTLLDNDHFLVELSKLFQKARTSKPQSITVTLKHYDGRTKPHPKNEAVLQHAHKSEDLCLFRAKIGDRKISTIVHAKEVNKFHVAYAGVLKVSMDNLKKREKKLHGDADMKTTGTPKKPL